LSRSGEPARCHCGPDGSLESGSTRHSPDETVELRPPDFEAQLAS
jgi:hypothetical protein